MLLLLLFLRLLLSLLLGRSLLKLKLGLLPVAVFIFTGIGRGREGFVVDMVGVVRRGLGDAKPEDAGYVLLDGVLRNELREGQQIEVGEGGSEVGAVDGCGS